jgi:hypothetical protein
MAPGADLTARPPPARIPKLKYRNPLPAGEKIPSLETRRDSAQQPHDSDEPPATPFSKAPSEYAPSFDTASLTSPSLASISSVASSDDSRSSKKKKKAGVFGFLSLKEPSQDAFKQYAEAQRKQAAEKGTTSPSSSAQPSSSYSAKKLPDSVPKVNSKWDGVPESVKNKHPKSSAASKKNRHSVLSQSSQSSQSSAGTWNISKASIMTDGSRNPPNSVASPAPSVSDLAIRARSRSSSPSPSTTTLPEMSYYFPQPLEHTAPHVESQLDAYHPSIFENTPRSSSSTSDLGSPLDQLPGLRPDSPASSTGSADTVVRDTADAIFKKLNDQPQTSFWSNGPAVRSPDEEVGATVPESHDFLFDDQPTLEVYEPAAPTATPHVPHYAPTRPVQNFSRPMSSPTITPSPRSIRSASYRTTPIGSALPTLYEASMASTDSVHSAGSDETVQDDRDADSYSIAPSTVAPSELSAHWHDSPRERLGLGGRLRMNAETPWEGQGEEPGKLKKYRLSMFGKVTPRASWASGT